MRSDDGVTKELEKLPKLEISKRSVNVVRMGKSLPLKRTRLTNQIQVFRIPDCSSPRMPRHIRDLNIESARDFKFNQAARWSNNKENDQKMADNAYLFRANVLYTCVS